MTASSSTPLPDWLSINGMTLSGTPVGADESAAANYDLVVTPLDGSDAVTVTLAITVSATADALGQAAMNLDYTESSVTKIVGNRPPSLAELPTPANSFAMRFYYKTLPGFAWPGKTVTEGSIVPYLRPPDGSGGYLGGIGDKTASSLDIVYRPVWPADTPVLNLSETLTNPKKGLPGVRGQTSIKALYQQSIALNFLQGENAASVILHDPTREKTYALSAGALEEIPASVKTFGYQGKTYFPNLPPYLSQRFFFDPNKGAKGSLVFLGEFVDEIVGEKYLLLNVLSGNDLDLVKDLCPAADTDNKTNWDAAVVGLSTSIETFYEPKTVPGTWIANTSDDAVTGKSGDVAPKPTPVGISEIAAVTHDDTAVHSYALSASGPGVGYVTLISNDGNDPTKAGLPVSVHIIRVGQPLYQGEIKVLYSSNPLDEKVTFQHTADLGGKFADFYYEWMIQPPVVGAPPKVYYATTDSGYDSSNPKALASGWSPLDQGSGAALPLYTLGGSGIQTLSDNYIIMRYKPTHASHPVTGQFSDWTEPQLAEGWIKRVLAGINPFNQRAGGDGSVNTSASMLTQAGERWEGDIALNLDSINDHGLIAIYETVLNRGKMLSIEGGINYGPANDALLLAAGYLNDLYMMVGNEAYADAANPTIGIGTKDGDYGDIATALFSFKGQMATLLEEELGLLRGRDDFIQPGVETGPVYNRMFWNYTRGIDSGEVIYALNYNIQEDQGQELDGIINAEDAHRMYPQGHGDAYGHYLSALKGYYKLVTDVDFTWAPRTEAVTVLGKAVQVDYMDERKFAAAAAALARTGQQVFDLTWRKDYTPDKDSGWGHFRQTRSNDRRTVQSTRRWGMDHWATRAGIGSMLNWVVGNAMLPAVDNDPDHEGIMKIDRTTVPELMQLTAVAESLQTSLDNAEAGMNPLGLSEDGIAFDMDPSDVQSETHFEQISKRATLALQNAVLAFDGAKDVTQMMRSEEDSLNDLQTQVELEEFAFENRLIELYGTPYSDDIGVGKTYKQGYAGPDLLHYTYMDQDERIAGTVLDPRATLKVKLDIQNVPTTWLNYNDEGVLEKPTTDPRVRDFIKNGIVEDGFLPLLMVSPTNDGIGSKNDNIEDEMEKRFFGSDGDLSDRLVTSSPSKTNAWRVPWTGVVSSLDFGNYYADDNEGNYWIEYELGPHGFFSKPKAWTGRRESPGRIQTAISEIIKARNSAHDALANHVWLKYQFDRHIELFKAWGATDAYLTKQDTDIANTERDIAIAVLVKDVAVDVLEFAGEMVDDIYEAASDATPDTVIVGMAGGGDIAAPAKIPYAITQAVAKVGFFAAQKTLEAGVGASEIAADREIARIEIDNMGTAEGYLYEKEAILELEAEFNDLRSNFYEINDRIQTLSDAKGDLLTLMADGNALQKEREIFRQRASAVIQGFRTRDAAFRIFRNEKLERYKSLYDLAARYTYLAAKAYDYETGLLHTDKGKSFFSRIVQSRSLGVMQDGMPQFAGSNTGDPGLSSVLAEMGADWSTLKGRLGFNNPDTYGTTVSMRGEKFRVLPGADGDDNWRDLLETFHHDNLLSDNDVATHCMQINNGDGLPVPGLIIEFGTVIQDGLNLFGKPLAPFDSYFSPTSFANKIHAVGIAFDGYRGMSDSSNNNSAVVGAGGNSPASPGGGFLDPQGLSATPYVYLIPVGLDSMRSPPLGDVSVVRTWNVQDVAVPLPFNIGGSGYSTKALWQSEDSLSEKMFSVRKHQAFRAAPSADAFVDNPRFFPENQTNNRLIGRSVWNSKWKLVIPGRALLNDPDEGLDRFINTVKDIQIHFRTYSYSGN
jgi:hypothetical protein